MIFPPDLTPGDLAVLNALVYVTDIGSLLLAAFSGWLIAHKQYPWAFAVIFVAYQVLTVWAP
jgi:hypothetical protein